MLAMAFPPEKVVEVEIVVLPPGVTGPLWQIIPSAADVMIVELPPVPFQDPSIEAISMIQALSAMVVILVVYIPGSPPAALEVVSSTLASGNPVWETPE